MLEVIRWFPLRRFALAHPMSARLSLSVPPEVKKTSFAFTFKSFEIVSFASRI